MTTSDGTTSDGTINRGAVMRRKFGTFEERLLAAPEPDRRRILSEIPREWWAGLFNDWPQIARPEQLPPERDDWLIWFIMAGRGFGKTRAGAEWVDALARADGSLRIALVGATLTMSAT